MEEGKPSASASISAMVRAAHLLWDQPPKIFEDTLALQLSGCESEAALKAQMEFQWMPANRIWQILVISREVPNVAG